jgi:hypothetical protein
MHDEIDDKPLTEEELALARKGEALIAAAVADTQAPQSLRESIERERTRAGARPRVPFWRRRAGMLAGAGAAAVAVAVVVAIGVGSDDEAGAPTLASVDSAAALAPTEGAPAPVGGTPPNLDANVGAVKFPDWEKKFAWKATGRRDAELDGRDVTTVHYTNPKGARLGYAVVDGEALDEKPKGREVTHAGKKYFVASAGGRTTVTWEQQGHTCVISAPSTVAAAKLVELAGSRNT